MAKATEVKFKRQVLAAKKLQQPLQFSVATLAIEEDIEYWFFYTDSTP